MVSLHSLLELGVGEHACNPCTGEAKAVELSIRGHPGLYSEILFPKVKPNL